jgi:hypothetical protein
MLMGLRCGSGVSARHRPDPKGRSSRRRRTGTRGGGIEGVGERLQLPGQPQWNGCADADSLPGREVKSLLGRAHAAKYWQDRVPDSF